jgi:DNA invertase Pin-like site-specific DNA recombinase
MSKTSAFAYLRVSGRGQLGGDGFPRQLAAIQKFAAAQDMRLTKVFKEQAVPGATEWSHRPAWLEMLRAIADDGVRTIVIEKLDRLARDLLVQEHILADLRRRGVTLISVAEPDLCLDDPTRKLMRQIVGAIAEYDKTMIVIRLREARNRKRAAAGKCEGRKFFGDKPGEAAIRDRIRAMRKAGSTLQAICDTLNSEGVTTRYGKVWMPMTVQRIAGR